MWDKKYYVQCESHCKYEGMTKEQILTAIEQAVSTGEIKDVDTGFITKIKEQNYNGGLSFWVGTQAEYNAISEKDENCFYITTDDATEQDLYNYIDEKTESVNARCDNLQEQIDRHGKLIYENNSGEVYLQCKVDEAPNYNIFYIEYEWGEVINAVYCERMGETSLQGITTYFINNIDTKTVHFETHIDTIYITAEPKVVEVVEEFNAEETTPSSVSRYVSRSSMTSVERPNILKIYGIA